MVRSAAGVRCRIWIQANNPGATRRDTIMSYQTHECSVDVQHRMAALRTRRHDCECLATPRNEQLHQAPWTSNQLVRIPREPLLGLELA